MHYSDQDKLISARHDDTMQSLSIKRRELDEAKSEAHYRALERAHVEAAAYEPERWDGMS